MARSWAVGASVAAVGKAGEGARGSSILSAPLFMGRTRWGGDEGDVAIAACMRRTSVRPGMTRVQ